jgi:isopenicillin N synthase-like dioxygenase
MLETWTNGELTATSHRVRKVSEERYSFPLFFSCDYEVEVAPLSCFVAPDRPARYPAIKAGEHLYAQTVQSFSYLKQRLARGELSLPQDARPLSSFGQEGKAIYERGPD